MKDYALQLAASQKGRSAKLNILREYLQAYLLRGLHETDFFQHAAFMGGTALRFLHGLPRFSEDLDFALEKKKGYRFEYLLADAFRKNMVRLSSAESEFLNAFKNEWIGWQGDALADMGHDDALDAVFGVFHIGMDYLVFGNAYKEREYSIGNPLFHKEKKRSPFSQLGR